MGSKTVVSHSRTSGTTSEVSVGPSVLGIQSDIAFDEAARRLRARDLCSISDLSVSEMAAIMELAHAVKAQPQEFRHSLDARQMVMFFEKASLRTRLTFEAGINTLGGNAIFVDQTQSPLGERESPRGYGSQSRALDEYHCPSNLLPRDRHRDGILLQGAGH